MALTQLTDIIVPAVFDAYMRVDTTAKAEVFTSGLVQMDAKMSELLSGGGRTFQTPFWNDLDNSDPIKPTDNPADVGVPLKVTATKMQFVRQMDTQGWSSADLVRELAGSDPLVRIRERVSAYWGRYLNRVAISTLNGVIAANVANNSGDMVYDVTAKTGTTTIGGVTVPAYTLSADAILEAKQTMGDRADGLKIIVMHSRLFTNLQKQNLIQYIPNAAGIIEFPTYLGYRVVVSDTMPAVAVSSDTIFTSYLASEGVLGFGESPPEIPVEVYRRPDQGNGMGIEQMWTRRQWAMQPMGHNWKDVTVTGGAGQFPTRAELELAANWERKYPERKQIAFAAIKTKNG